MFTGIDTECINSHINIFVITLNKILINIRVLRI